MLKKLLSVLLASSLLLGICPAALAQQVESQDKSWLQTFTGLAQNTAPEEMLLSGVPANYTGADALPEEQRNIAVTQGAAGKFGKKADDMAFVARTKWDDGLAFLPLRRIQRLCRPNAEKRRRQRRTRRRFCRVSRRWRKTMYYISALNTR